MSRSKVGLAACVAVLFGGTASPAGAQNLPSEVVHYADIVMYNGPVLTVDKDTPDFTVVQAVAVRDGRILAVGDSATILKMAGPATKKIDLAGKAVIPGVVDTHSHPNRYALAHYQQDFMPQYVKWLGDNHISNGAVRWNKGKDAAMAMIKAVADKAPAGNLVYIGTRGDPIAMNDVNLADLDKACPNHELFIGIGNEMWGLVNTKMLDRITGIYGKGLSGIRKDKDGNPTGLLFGSAGSVVGYEIFPQVPPEMLAPIFKKELEEWAAMGVTTLSSRFKGTEISAYGLLARKGELPIRIAFTSELARWNPYFSRDMKRLGNIQDYGILDTKGPGDKMWMMGLSVGIPDGSPPGGGGAAGGDVCSDLKKREKFPDDSFYDTNGICYWLQPGDPTKETVMEANRYGYRIAGVHQFGDKGAQIAFDTYALAAAEKPWSAPGALDHGMMISPEVIKKTVASGSEWSLQVPMLFGNRTGIVARVFGEEIAHKWSLPVKSLLAAGAKVSFGADAHGESAFPMHSLWVVVTRTTNDGRIWGSAEAIDRRTALMILTRNGAKYVLKKDIGSIEVGKLADLVVLDKNPIDPKVPDSALKDIKVLQTYIGGNIAWDAASGKVFPPSPTVGPVD